jgi:hypothetical protein
MFTLVLVSLEPFALWASGGVANWIGCNLSKRFTGSWDLPDTVFVSLWLPVVSKLLLSILDVLLSLDDVVVDTEVWNLVVDRVLRFVLVLLAWPVSRRADWVRLLLRGSLVVMVMSVLLSKVDLGVSLQKRFVRV